MSLQKIGNYLSAFAELITTLSQVVYCLRNCLQCLFLNSEHYAARRCVKRLMMMAQIPVHKCVIHPGI